MRICLVILFLSSGLFCHGQSLKILKPILGKENSYSKSESEYWRNAIDSLALSDNLESDIRYSDMSESTKKAIDSLENFFGPLTQTVACSWYCGGGPYKISSTSILENKSSYSDINIHDFDLLTAWVPEVKNGIGESISFHFKPNSPRVSAIIIFNGYLKNNDLWINNSRARKLKLLINNDEFAILELEDTSASQRFEIPPIRSTIENQDLVLTLEILDSYPGEKYQDLVISEINFDGLDSH